MCLANPIAFQPASHHRKDKPDLQDPVYLLHFPTEEGEIEAT